MVESNISLANSDEEIINKSIIKKYTYVLVRIITRNKAKRKEEIYSKSNDESYFLIFPIKNVDKDILDNVVE